MSSIDAVRRRFAFAAAAVCVVSSSACLDSMAPTPTSSVITITPTTRSIPGLESPAGNRFTLEFRIRNTGSRPIYVDRVYGRTEKLIDQKWEMVMERIPPAFASVRVIPPGQSITFEHLVQYVRGVSPSSPYLEHIRGLYRARLRFSYLANGSEPLPSEESYSEPFVVNN